MSSIVVKQIYFRHAVLVINKISQIQYIADLIHFFLHIMHNNMLHIIILFAKNACFISLKKNDVRLSICGTTCCVVQHEVKARVFFSC